jgi:hypothetical protein
MKAGDALTHELWLTYSTGRDYAVGPKGEASATIATSRSCARGDGPAAMIVRVLSLLGPDRDEEFRAILRLVVAAPALLAACQRAKELLVHDLTEPGRTIFWEAANAIGWAEARDEMRRDE